MRTGYGLVTEFPEIEFTHKHEEHGYLKLPEELRLESSYESFPITSVPLSTSTTESGEFLGTRLSRSGKWRWPDPLRWFPMHGRWLRANELMADELPGDGLMGWWSEDDWENGLYE